LIVGTLGVTVKPLLFISKLQLFLDWALAPKVINKASGSKQIIIYIDLPVYEHAHLS